MGLNGVVNGSIGPRIDQKTHQALLDRKLVAINQAAELAGVSRKTIYNWIRADKIEYVRNAGGAIRIFTDSLVHKSYR